MLTIMCLCLGADFAKLDAAVLAAIKEGQAPGAVVAVIHKGGVRIKAYGKRAVVPKEEAMTEDTVFDLASLTKPVATGTSVMLLVERGKLSLSDPVSKHLPGLTGHGKEKITVEQLMLHTSGLSAGNALAHYEGGAAKALENINGLKPAAKPGERFTYSDVGFIVLGALVEKVSGETLGVFSRKEIFQPLDMKDTGYSPAKEVVPRIAPTTKGLRGAVHDPRARLLGGVAGHAGLFGTAADLAVYVKMLLDGGKGPKGRLLKEETVRLFTTAREVPKGERTPGWDVKTGYSHNRGEVFGGYGHTGFTGTGIWIDPARGAAVIVLTSRLHPDGKGNVNRLRREAATLAARAVLGE